MKNYLDRLQTIFTGMIGNSPKLPSLAPAFFSDNLLSTIATPSFEAVADPCPFDVFWMIYESHNPPFGTISNVVLCRDRTVRLWGLTHGIPGAKLRFMASFDLDDPSKYDLPAIGFERTVRETIPEMRLMLSRISNHERQEVTPEVLHRLNAKRGKANVKKVAPYIVLDSKRSETKSQPTGTHASPQPHQRRGHWRTYKATGNRVWVNDCKVKGGSPVPRDYRLAA